MSPHGVGVKGRRVRVRRVAAGVAAGITAVVLSSCSAANEQGASESGLSGELNGAGASSQEAAIRAMTKGFQTPNPGVTVNYDPVGSGSGREQFIAGGVDFAGTDVALTDEELAAAKERCASDVLEVPTYVSPIAVVFHVPGVDELNLSADTIAGIFAGDITRWSDDQIAADNVDTDLPDMAITPVHRSDRSGTTANFTDYLAEASGTWDHGSVESWPFSSGEGAEGTAGVISAVGNGKGTIGYADASQARELSIAKIKVGSRFVAYSPEAASTALDVSQRVAADSDSVLRFELDRTPGETDAYPLILVSYQLACTQYEAAETADLVKAWFGHVASSQGQTASAEGAGSAPLPEALQQDIQHIAGTIGAS